MENRNMTKTNKNSTAFALVALFISTSSFAAANTSDHTGISVGGLGGFSSFSSGSTTTGNIGFGGRADLRFGVFSVGGEWTMAWTTPSTGVPTGYSSNLALATVNFDYHLDNLLENLFVGVKGGMAFVAAGGFTGSSITFGGELGWDYYFGPISVGPQINFLYVAAPTLNNIAFASGTDFQALAAVKYHF